ncbi:MAG: family rane protein, partial [Tardiphaga sp.]|nr:family rane protein [Tardiphaga sp.]
MVSLTRRPGAKRPAIKRKPPIDPQNLLIREFVTPEGVDLRLQLGSAGERAGAFLLDGVIIIVAFMILAYAAQAAAGAFGLAEGEGREFVAAV